MRDTKALASLGAFLALGLIVSTFLATNAMRDIRMSHQIIKVRGYAEIPVDADLAMWGITIKAHDPAMTPAYQELAVGRTKVLAYLDAHGVSDHEITVKSVRVSQRRKKGEKGYDTHEVVGFDLSQRIEIKSNDVANISKIFAGIAELVGEGVEMNAGTPSYHYTGVNEIKSELLVKATEDARERARTLAEGSGTKLGPLRAARQGVFNVRAADSTSISESTGEDTSSIAKKVTAVVTVDYAMR